MDGMSIIQEADFLPKTLDKVMRLLTVLDELGRHPTLKGKLCMHGGTAINLFMLDAPRLSVDIDLSYIGAIEREAMLAERPIIEKAVGQVATTLGYTIPDKKGDHAGRTFQLRYAGNWGADSIKIDLIYLNRAPILTPVLQRTLLHPNLQVLMFSDYELVAGKVKALFDRVKIRDIYDIVNLYKYLENHLVERPEDDNICHKTILFYASLSNHFPLPFEHRALERFSGREKEMKDQLYPVLRMLDRPSLDTMINTVEDFISHFVLPRDDTERDYLERFAQAEYCPELLFGEDSSMKTAARNNPEALWKLQNLEKWKKESSSKKD
ncbi:MAG: nucleotidyl transferase AbiEii/AbiGii toxin family protein [Coriobacteriia bacterium]|nr:nucleotidyl transferase AbiEii/AbiGii toxin family protein [Coriobacteriia bacterium]